MPTRRILFLDLGEFGALSSGAGALEQWQDHGLGLLRTLLQRERIPTDVASVRSCRSWEEVAKRLRGVDLLVMNVRSYTFPQACEAARQFKRLRPSGLVLVGGIHAAVAPHEMEAVPEFDRICTGPGEGVIADLVRRPESFPRIFPGKGAKSLGDWPAIDRRLWPKPPGRRPWRRGPWPLEPSCGWGPAPVATLLTSRRCPWQCVFCNEGTYVPAMARRPVRAVIDELNGLDRQFGPLGSVVIHDSLFFQSPAWLREWLAAYPRCARRPWPYWAAARTDLIRRWPDLFEALLRETPWTVVSLGLESGSDKVLRTLNKECTAADHAFAIDLINRVGDDLAAAGRVAPRVWANIMLGNPGETHEEAFMTLRMVRRVKRCLMSPSFYAPYPGSALGWQLMAEGRSLMTPANYHRYPHDEKLRGVDYAFYRRLLAGHHDKEIAAGAWPEPPPGGGDDAAGRAPTRFFLFAGAGGRRKLAYGPTPAAALATLAYRLSPEAMQAVQADAWEEIHPPDIAARAAELG